MNDHTRSRALRVLRYLGFALILPLVAAIGSAHAWEPLDVRGHGELPFAAPSSTFDWPQVQRDPQRTGYTPEVMGSTFRVAWTHRFSPEKVYPQVQAIVYQGKVYVGTEMGNVYALHAETGAPVWTYHVGAPVLSSVAAGDGRVYFGAMDGAVYALQATGGSLVWKSPLDWRLGFSTAPVLAEGKVMLGGRNGVFYALDPATGAKLWERDVGAPILQTAAYNNGRVFFGAMDMHFYALNTDGGGLAWKSGRKSGMAFKDYWPVVHQGKVLVRAMSFGENFYAFDEDTGRETITLPQYDGKTQHGATAPPAVNRNGHLIVPFPRPDGGGSCWGAMDLGTQQIVDDYEPVGGYAPAGGCANADENENVSCSNNLIVGLHTSFAGGVSTNSVFNLDSRTWTEIWQDVPPHQPSHNTQGGGGNPASLANGMIYHIAHHDLNAVTTR